MPEETVKAGSALDHIGLQDVVGDVHVRIVRPQHKGVVPGTQYMHLIALDENRFALDPLPITP